MAISPKLEFVVRVTKYPPSPEIEKGLDTDLVVVLVALWEEKKDKITDVAFTTKRLAGNSQLTTRRSSEYLTFPFSRENEV